MSEARVRALIAASPALLTKGLQAYIYPHRISVVKMRVAWKTEADIVGNPFTEAEFTGARSAVGTTAGVNWQEAAGGFTGRFGIWIFGNTAPAWLTNILNTDWRDARYADRWNAAGRLTIAGEEGGVWVNESNRSRIGRFSPNTAQAILDPGVPA